MGFVQVPGFQVSPVTWANFLEWCNIEFEVQKVQVCLFWTMIMIIPSRSVKITVSIRNSNFNKNAFRHTGRALTIGRREWGDTCLGGVPARAVPAQGVYLLGLPAGGCTCPGGSCPGTPPCEQNDRQVQKYYLAPNFVCGR